MKYRHFLKFLKTNPDVSWLSKHIGPPQLRDWARVFGSEHKLYIQEVVKFVDFRDWDKLDLAAPLSVKKDVVLNGLNNPSREETRYVVRYHTNEHTGGVDPLCAEKRGEYNYWSGGHVCNSFQKEAPATLRDLLEDYWIWSYRARDYEIRKHSDVIFDAVLKITRIWDGDWDRYNSESIEIFRFPEHLKPKSVWRPPAKQAA